MRHQLVASNAVARPAERGSAYIVALLALLVLTIGGLSVSLVTQTELQVGMNERAITRNFYAAESALNVVTGYILTEGGGCIPYLPTSAEQNWLVTVSAEERDGLRFADTAQVDAAMILFKGCCNWCPCQEGQNDQVHRLNYGIFSEAERISWGGAIAAPPGGVPDAGYAVVSRKTVGMVLDIQPFVAGELAKCLDIDPTTFGRVRF